MTKVKFRSSWSSSYYNFVLKSSLLRVTSSVPFHVYPVHPLPNQTRIIRKNVPWSANSGTKRSRRKRAATEARTSLFTKATSNESIPDGPATVTTPWYPLLCRSVLARKSRPNSINRRENFFAGSRSAHEFPHLFRGVGLLRSEEN